MVLTRRQGVRNCSFNTGSSALYPSNPRASHFSTTVYCLRPQTRVTPARDAQIGSIRRMVNESSSFKLGTAKIVNSKPLQTSDSKWIGLKSIEWADETGKTRHWECSFRKRSENGFDNVPDAVAIFSILSRPDLPDATILVLQYRPPVGKIVVELPAGLVDSDEKPEQTALRELYEETGYGRGPQGGEVVVENVTRIVANDPGMSSANMSLVKLRIKLDSDKAPESHPDIGEHIVVQVVPLADLYSTLTEYSKREEYMVDARLMHLAMGISA